jgi:hypothetical protein
MKGSIPIAGDDFINSANGFKFGVGLNNPTGDENIMTLTIEKAKGSGTPMDPNSWQIQLEDYDPVAICNSKFAKNMVLYYRDFLNRAHEKLKQITGAGIPGWPSDPEAQLRWMIKHGTTYSASGFVVNTPQ